MLTHLQGVKLLPPTISSTLLSTFVTITTSLCLNYWQTLCNHYRQPLSLLLTTYYHHLATDPHHFQSFINIPSVCHHYHQSLSLIIDNRCNHYHQPLSLLSTLVTITTSLCHYYCQPLCYYYHQPLSLLLSKLLSPLQPINFCYYFIIQVMTWTTSCSNTSSTQPSSKSLLMQTLWTTQS